MSRARRPLLVLGAIALLAAGWGGLARIGVLPVVPAGDAATYHGALMVSGFIGTLIALERAVVVRRWWAELAPILSAAGAVGVIFGVPPPYPALAVTAAALLLVAVALRGAPTSPPLTMTVMAIGAAAWAVGAALWADGAATFRSTPWWILFLVLTIAAERMELSRALRPSASATVAFAGASGVFAVGVALTLIDEPVGIRVAGAGLLVLALLLGLRDRPPAAARALPLPSYIAMAIAIAYVWLAVGALFMVAYDGIPAGLRYDAMLHSVFVGFVFSMILAHAPIVLPAITGTAVRFRRALFVPLALLHGALVIRVMGDVATRTDWRDWGGLLVGVALILFLASMIASARPRRAESRRALAAARRA